MVYIFSVFAHNRLIYIKNKGVLLHLIHHFSCKKRNFVVILQRQKVNSKRLIDCFRLVVIFIVLGF